MAFNYRYRFRERTPHEYIEKSADAPLADLRAARDLDDRFLPLSEVSEYFELQRHGQPAPRSDPNRFDRSVRSYDGKPVLLEF